jgi:hypothetical protein
LLNFQIKGKLSAPLRIRAVTGTQPSSPPDGKKPPPVTGTLCSRMRNFLPTTTSRKPRNSLQFACWLPIVSLVAVEFYVRNFDGWGAWSTAPLFLLPLILSVVIAGVGVVQFFLELGAGAMRTSTAFFIALALIPFLWLLIRRHVI